MLSDYSLNTLSFEAAESELFTASLNKPSYVNEYMDTHLEVGVIR